MAKPYKLGERNTDLMLEILNLDKKEVISIDEISNQEFSEVIKHTAICSHPSVLVIFLYILQFLEQSFCLFSHSF